MTDQRKVLIFESSFSLSNYLVKKWVLLAQEAISQRGRFTVALSGGRTPTEFYTKLSGLEDFNLWQKTHLFQADERFVPHDDSESNYKMIKETLLNYVPIPKENVHLIDVACENAGLAAEEYKNSLVVFFDFRKNNLPCFDLILLGVGPDGHTASLFPDTQGISDPRRVTLPVSSPHLKDDRVSLTVSTINNARRVVFLILGTGKAAIAKAILEENFDCPAQKVQPTDGEVIYLLDREAARKLSYHDNYTFDGEALSL